MKKAPCKIITGFVFIFTVILFSLANNASKILEVNNPLKATVKPPAIKNISTTGVKIQEKKPYKIIDLNQQ